MNLLLEVFDTFARLAVFYLLNGVWVGCVVLFLCLGLLRVLRHALPAIQHRIIWVAVVAIVIVPLFLSVGGRASFDRHGNVMINSHMVAISLDTQAVSPDQIENDKQTELRQVGSFASWPLYVAGAWGVVCVVLVGRLIGGALYLRALIQKGQWAFGDVQALFEQCKRRWGGQDVQLRFVKGLKGPLAVGLIHPMILLPEDWVSRLSKEEVEQILVHELAHVDRYDLLGNWVQRVLEAVLWMNPAIWVLSRRLSLTRELACDEWAVRFGRGRKSYAACLVRLVELMQSQSLSTVGVGMGGSLKKRIEHILATPQTVGWFTKRGFWIGCVGVLVAGLLCVQLGALFEVSGRAEAYMRVSKWNATLAKILIGNPLPRGIGLSSKVIVVAEDADWRVVQPALERVLLQPVLTPQPENVFELVHVLPKDLDAFRAYRNVIVVGKPNTYLGNVVDGLGGQESVVIRKDVWATNQVVVGVKASEAKDLAEQIAMDGDRLVSVVDEEMAAWLSSILYHAGVQKEATEKLASDFGWQVQVPVGFDIMLDYADQKFVTFAKQVDRRQLWMWVYWEEGVSPDQLTPDWCLKKRNAISAKFYGGDQTDLNDLKIYQTEFGGKLAVCMEGLWENTQAWQGGPFKSYAVMDADRGRFYMIDVGIYAPNQTKALHLRQLDALAHTFKIPVVYAMESNPKTKSIYSVPFEKGRGRLVQ